MVAPSASPQDFIRLPIVLGLGLGLFLLDLALPAALGLVQLYPVALLALYGVRTLRVIAACWMAYCSLILAGYVATGGGGDATSRAVLMLAVSLAALALTRIAAREQALHEDALIDPLTGIFNRRCFLELSDKEAARTRRHGNASAVLMLDIDHFKGINDRYGHSAGDAVLRAMADVCAKLLRPSDILARYGGEEFVICLAETDEERARHVAERLRKSIERSELRSGQHAIKCTVSIGVAGCSAEAPLNEAITRADAALYRAKAAGRNRVELAAEPGPNPSTPSATERVPTGAGSQPAAAARPVKDVILIVDDEPDIRGLLAEWLGDHGYTVVTAGNAMDALQLLEADASIDLVVTDIVMPGGLNGFDLGRRAERLRPDIKLLYMSAYAIAETIRAAQDDALPMMHKPFKLDRLLESVEAVLQH